MRSTAGPIPKYPAISCLGSPLRSHAALSALAGYSFSRDSQVRPTNCLTTRVK